MTLDPDRRAEIAEWAAAWVRENADLLARLERPDPVEETYDRARGLIAADGDLDLTALRAAIEAADRDPLTHDALCWLGAGFVRRAETAAEMPEDLRQFLAEVLAQNRPRPSRRRGRPSPSAERDHAVVELIDRIVMNFGIAPTRAEDADHSDSACDFAAAALRQAGLRPNSYGRLAQLWCEYDGPLLSRPAPRRRR